MLLKIGTRASQLAIKQTELVIEQIKNHYPNISYQITPIITTADKIQNRNLYDIGGKALFLKEIEEALLRDEIDIAIHALKDVPGILAPEFKIAAVLEREDPREVFISSKYSSIEELPIRAKVGTSSVRRRAYLLAFRPDLEIVTFRGNVDSRIKKILSHTVDASLITAAGLKRLGLYNDSYCHIINTDKILPAAAQGVIGVEIKKNSSEFLQGLCNKINHTPTFNLMKLERAFLEELNASCDTPLAAYARYENGKIKADFMLEHGNQLKFYSEKGGVSEGKEMGVRAAKYLASSYNMNLL